MLFAPQTATAAADAAALALLEVLEVLVAAAASDWIDSELPLPSPPPQAQSMRAEQARASVVLDRRMIRLERAWDDPNGML
ncbi:hypothetical protein ACQUJS_21180 [Ralstonia pseudosolanacearum]|uniref:Uncharacterized protein n=1 Tax=Ralstonia solanacearum TaxID=305 RepID=A0A0S4TX32_RALSL|nr:conserved protein of unknown function [Ralstonia solanacearum]